MPGICYRARHSAAAIFAGILSVAASLEAVAANNVSRTTAELIPASEPGWPQFRGKHRDGKSDERGLLQAWPPAGPTRLWSANDLGRGYSSPIIVNDLIYITGDAEGEVHLFCLASADGKRLWSVPSGRSWTSSYPGARATPTYSNGRVYLLNGHGDLRAFDAADGKVLWEVNLLSRFKGENITWGMSECLVVDERLVYATAGGRDALVVAFDKSAGELVWKSEPLLDPARNNAVETASYAAPILVRFAGRALLIGCSGRHLYCVDAATGAIQWTQPMPTSYSVLAMSPALVGDAIFMTAPHGKPGALFQLLPPESPTGAVRVEKRWETNLDTCQGSVVYHDGKIIGSYYPGRKGWAALDAVTGETLYRAEEVVKGAILYADKRLYILSENGWIRLMEPAAQEFKIHGEFRLAEANNDAWAHPVILQKRLYLRYGQNLHCYDIAAP